MTKEIERRIGLIARIARAMIRLEASEAVKRLRRGPKGIPSILP